MNQYHAPSNNQATTHLIVVMGVSGSGKSSLARALAEYYGYSFLDGDDFHSDAARTRMASGLPLTDEMRAPWVASICSHLHDRTKKQEHCVLAFSGLKKMHRNQLRTVGLKTLFLFLRGDKATIQERMEKRVNHFMAPTLLESQFSSLEDPSQESDVIPLDITKNLTTLCHQAIQIIDQEYALSLLIAK